MIQPNNRHMSVFLYLTVLAVAETIILILGRFFEYVNVRAPYLEPGYNQVVGSVVEGDTKVSVVEVVMLTPRQSQFLQ